MKITALTHSASKNLHLANYVLSLFEHTKTEVITLSDVQLEMVNVEVEGSNLIIIILEGNCLNKEVLNLLKDKPVVLINIYLDLVENKRLISKIIEDLGLINSSVWGVFSLSHSNVNSTSHHPIKDTGLRLQLIRMINSIMFHDLGIRNNNKFSCGITPPKYYVGDSIGY